MREALKGRSLLEPMDFSLQELEDLFSLADEIIAAPEAFAEACKGKLLATLFYEPSTRTRFSFEAAMLRLGGRVIGFSEPNSSSVAKGESVADTIRTVACYADIAVMRHPKEGAPRVAAYSTEMPVINAGDGGHQHPTQTLTDLLTIRRERGHIGDITVGLCGDLKFGRTVHSLIKALSRYEGVRFVLISPEELRIPDYVRQEVLGKGGIPFRETEHLREALPVLDVLYMTRVQKERFFNEEDYIRLRDRYILDGEKMKLAKKDMMVLHPLPRVNEIAVEVDRDSRALYFRQAKYGMYVRMALIMALLGAAGCGADAGAAEGSGCGNDCDVKAGCGNDCDEKAGCDNDCDVEASCAECAGCGNDCEAVAGPAEGSASAGNRKKGGN